MFAPWVDQLLLENNSGGFQVFPGSAVTNFSTSNKLTSSGQMAFGPGMSLVLIVDNINSLNSNDCVIGCGNGILANAARKGWSVNLMGNQFLAVNGSGDGSHIGYFGIQNKFGLQVHALRWQASDNHCHYGINGALTGDFGFPITPGNALDGTCQSVIGAPFTGDTNAGKYAGGILGFAILNREISDGELTSFTAFGTGTRLRLPASVVNDSAATVIWEASQDWDGVSGTSITRGSSPITFTVNGSPTKTNMAEMRIPVTDSILTDSKVSIQETNYTYHNCFAHIKAVTSATRVGIEAFQANGPLAQPRYGIWKNGSFLIDPAPINSSNVNYQDVADVNLGSGSNKNMDFIEGTQLGNSPYPTGFGMTHINALRIQIAQPSFTFQSPTRPTNRAVFLGDSIFSGFGTTDVMSDSMSLKLRADLNGSVTNFSWGNATLKQLCDGTYYTTNQTAALLGQMLDGTAKNTLVIQVQTNDYAGGASAASYQTNLTNLCLAVEALGITGLKIICCGATQRISPASEAANGAGSTLGDFRTAAQTVAGLNPSIRSYDDLSAVILNSDIAAVDGVHVTTSGNQKFHDHYISLLGF